MPLRNTGEGNSSDPAPEATAIGQQPGRLWSPAPHPPSLSTCPVFPAQLAPPPTALQALPPRALWANLGPCLPLSSLERGPVETRTHQLPECKSGTGSSLTHQRGREAGPIYSLAWDSPHRKEDYQYYRSEGTRWYIHQPAAFIRIVGHRDCYRKESSLIMFYLIIKLFKYILIAATTV